jgi:hypothetical protein
MLLGARVEQNKFLIHRKIESAPYVQPDVKAEMEAAAC